MFDRVEVSIPAAILVDGEDAIAGARQLNQLASFVTGGDEGLIQHDMLAGFESLHGQLEMRGWRRADDDQVEVRQRQQFFHAARNCGIGIGLRGGIAMSLQNGG